ncbi:hypothetical protein ACJJTC_003208 [Scirpophaga incertulas]
MRIYLLFFVFLFISYTVARPSNTKYAGESAAEEVDYEIDESPSDESLQEYDEAQVDDQETELEGLDEESVRQGIDNFDNHHLRAVSNKWSDRSNDEYKAARSTRTGNKQDLVDSLAQANANPKMQKQRTVNKYANSNNGIAMRSSNYNTQLYESYKDNVKKNSEAIVNDNEILFDTQRENRKNEHTHDNDGVESNERPYKYPLGKNQPNDNFDKIERLDMIRDRRQAEKNKDILELSKSSTDKTSMLFQNENEDEEAAIKRHIKKLSGDELEELLNSLSDDKKTLLNKIIENNNAYDTQNKREITKKAGASDKNSLIDGGLLELGKSQDVNSNVSDINTGLVFGKNFENVITSSESQSDNDHTSSSKAPDSTQGDSKEGNAELSVDNINNNNNVNKRDTNFDNEEHKSFDRSEYVDSSYQSLDYLSNDKNNYCASHEVGLEQQTDEEPQSHKQNKRELLPTKQFNIDDIKLLEDSFPNDNPERSSQYIEANMVPLVRVKRKDDKDITQRTIIPDDKAAYCPLNVDNDDSDNDEGNEFNNDGIYDRTLNFAKRDLDKLDDGVNHFGVKRENNRKQSGDEVQIELSNVSTNNKFDDGTRSIGSDTDSVLSGVEGVDDNLMLNGGPRNRRAFSGSLKPLAKSDSKRLLRSTPVNVGVDSVDNSKGSNFKGIGGF